MAPHEGGPWKIQAVALGELGRHHAAVDSWDRATSLLPCDAKAWGGKAAELSLTGHHTKALEAVDHALLLNPNDARLHDIRGTILMRLARPEEALHAYGRALETVRENSMYWANRGTAYIRLDRFVEARGDLERALALEPPESDAAAYREALGQLRASRVPLIWWDWWFTQGSLARRVSGGAISILLTLYLLAPLVTVNDDKILAQNRLWWLNLGQDWTSYVLPVVVLLAVLLSPMLRRIGPEGVHLEPILGRPAPADINLEPSLPSVDLSAVDLEPVLRGFRPWTSRAESKRPPRAE